MSLDQRSFSYFYIKMVLLFSLMFEQLISLQKGDYKSTYEILNCCAKLVFKFLFMFIDNESLGLLFILLVYKDGKCCTNSTNLLITDYIIILNGHNKLLNILRFHSHCEM